MRQPILAVQNVRTGLFEQCTRRPAEFDRDHRIERPVPERDGGQRRRQVELETLDRRDEAAQRDQRDRSRPSGTETQGVAHHGALRESAEHEPLRSHAVVGQEVVQPAHGLRIHAVERPRIGEAELPERVPVPATGRQGERGARRRSNEAAFRIEEVEQREQIELVRAASVEQDECSLGLACRGLDARPEAHGCKGWYFARTSST